MSAYTPELGQSAFSNTPWQEHEVPELAIAALSCIGEEIERVMWNTTQKRYDSPTGNVGEEFHTGTFTMHSYCWCDGGLHPNGCPPNFTWKNVQICWYKYLGRGMSCNIKLTPDVISEMLMDCLKSVRALDVEY